MKIEPSPRIDYCSACKKDHGYDCPKDMPEENWEEDLKWELENGSKDDISVFIKNTLASVERKAVERTMYLLFKASENTNYEYQVKSFLKDYAPSHFIYLNSKE